MHKTALLLMDFQNGIVSRVSENTELLDRVKKVKSEARKAGIQTIYVVVKFREGFPEVSPTNKAFSMISSGGFPLFEGNPAVEIHESLSPDKSDIIVTKRRVSGFCGSDLEVVLRSQGINHIVLSGLATSGVVLSTLRAAADMDFQITVLSDCCGDRDDEVHKVLTEKVFPNQAEVLTAEQWIAQLPALVAAK